MKIYNGILAISHEKQGRTANATLIVRRAITVRGYISSLLHARIPAMPAVKDYCTKIYVLY